MEPIRRRSEILVDGRGFAVIDQFDEFIGYQATFTGGERLVYALPTDVTGGNESKRYHPPHPPGENCIFGMDFSNVIPRGKGIAQATIQAQTNTVPPAQSTDWTYGPIQVLHRALYCRLEGGVAGSDYRIMWTVTDSDGNVYPRVALLLCADTS